MKEQVLNILRSCLELDTIDETVSRKNCIRWDSLAHISIVVALESAFDLVLTPDEIGRIQSFEEIMSVLKEKNDGR